MPFGFVVAHRKLVQDRSPARPKSKPAATFFRLDHLEPRLLLSVYTFDDEFNGAVGSGPSSAWGAGNTTDPNNGAVHYTNTTPAEATASNPTTLQIVSDPLADDGKALAMTLMPDPGSSGNYVSAEITTEFDSSGAGNSLEYGHIEARIRLPGGSNSGAIWPAFWMLGDNISSVGWPASGEIDIMENKGSTPGTSYSHLHGPASGTTSNGGDYNGGDGIGSSYTLPGGASFYSSYHVFAADWGPNSVTFSVDGVAFETLTPADVPSGGSWPFNGHPFYIILDVCEGGGFAPGTITTPQTMYVDYVHAFAYSTAASPALADQDIGSPALAGSADFDGLTYTLNGSGTDVWGTSDEFNLDSQPMTGNATLITQVDWVSDTGQFAKGGLMIRDGTAADASYAFMQLNPANAGASGTGGASFEFRNGAGTSSQSAGTNATENLANGSIWLKLVRNGNVFSGYVSSNDLTWTQIGVSETIAMSATVQVGLADCSNNPSEISTDTFSNVSFLPYSFTDTDLGSPTRIGTSAYNNTSSTWTISGGGTGFAAASDQFNFISQSVTGDTDMAAKVTSQSSVNAAAMSGIMLRDGTGTTGAFAAAVVTPSDGVEFLWRTSNGATGSAVVMAKAAPLWLQISRYGNNFTAYYGTNGTNWTQIGTTQTIAMDSTLQDGLAVTSDDTVTTNTATFTNVEVLSITTTAAANPAAVTGTTTALSAYATDVLNDTGVTYTWAATTLPSGATAPTFTNNGTNAGQASTATFFKAGSYVLMVAARSQSGLSVTSSVSVTVNQAASTIVVSPPSNTISDAQILQLSASLVDQFGFPMATQPGGFTWSVVSGGAGSVSSSGLYSAPATGPGSATVMAESTNFSGTSTITTILSIIDATASGQTIRLARSGSSLNVFINSNTSTYTVAYASLGAITVNTLLAHDTVVLDFSSGLSPVPAAGVTVFAAALADTLGILGSSAADTVSINDASHMTVDGFPVVYLNLAGISFTGNGGGDTLIQAAQPGSGASLSFDGGASDTLNVSAGNYTIAANNSGGYASYSLSSLLIGAGASVTLADASTPANRTVLILGNLSLSGSSNSWTSSLNAGDNDLIIHNGNLAQITSQLQQGFAGGTWTGQGLRSSDAAASTSHLTALGVELNNDGGGDPLFGSGAPLGLFDGQNPATTDVLIKYTYYGDANLDGKVDASDYSRIDNGLLAGATGWSNGDFNYDGVINGSDYTLIDNAFNTQGAAILAAIAAPLPSASVLHTAVAVMPTEQSTQFANIFTTDADDLQKKKKMLLLDDEPAVP